MQAPSYSICFVFAFAINLLFSGDNKGDAQFPEGKFVNKFIVSLKIDRLR